MRKTPEIYFAGNSISPTYLADLIDVIGERDFSLNIISKSGDDGAGGCVPRIKGLCEKKYGKDGAKSRIYATTDKARGALEGTVRRGRVQDLCCAGRRRRAVLCSDCCWPLPIAVSGADIDKLMEGAAAGYEEYKNPDMNENICYQYAAVRNALYRKRVRILR